MSEEAMWRAVHAMREATDRANSAASRIEDATRTLQILFEDGYGGNALRLIELLEEKTVDVVTGSVNINLNKPHEG